MKKLLLLSLAVLALVLTVNVNKASATVVDKPKVDICHRTNSVTNPYTKNNVDQSSVDGDAGNDNGQGDHYLEHTGPLASSEAVAQNLKDNKIDWGDIIPPIAGVHSGLNWDAAGQAIYNNGCNYVTTVDVCPNLDGNQTEPPFGYVIENGVCVMGGQGGSNEPTPTATPTAAVQTLPFTSGNGQTNALIALGSMSAIVATVIQLLRKRFVA